MTQQELERQALVQELERLTAEMETAHAEAIALEERYIVPARRTPIPTPEPLTKAAMDEMDAAWAKHTQLRKARDEVMGKLWELRRVP